MRELEKRVLQLESHNDILLLIAAYARAGDCQNDPLQMSHFFTEDAIWDAKGFGYYKGRENIVEGLAHIGKTKMAWTLHFPITPVIQVSSKGDSASCFWWLWELADILDENGTTQSKWIGATYDAVVVSTDSTWKFNSLKLNAKTITKNSTPFNLV